MPSLGGSGSYGGDDPTGGYSGGYSNRADRDDWAGINADIGVPQTPGIVQTGVGYGIDAVSALNPISLISNIISRAATGDSFGSMIAGNLFGGPWGTMAPGPMVGFNQQGRLDNQGLPFGSVSDQGFGNNQAHVPNQFAPPQGPTGPMGFQLDPMQVQQDMGPWGMGYNTPQMNPINYGGMGQQQQPFDWGGFLNTFGGK